MTTTKGRRRAAVAAAALLLLVAGCTPVGEADPAPSASVAEGPPTDGAGNERDLMNGRTRASLLDERVGFGRGAGSGAMEWPEVVVTNLDDSGPGSLRKALSSGERWITFEPGLSGSVALAGADDPLEVPSDVVIDGRGADVTIHQSGDIREESGHVVFSITDDASNIVIANVTIGSTSDGIGVHGSGTSTGIRDLWFHHLTFEVFSIEDEAIGVNADAETDEARPKNITVSWSRFDGRGSGRAMILGGSEDPLSAPDFVTIHHNWFHDVEARQPLVQAARLHQYNNWHDGWGPDDDYAMAIGTDAQVYFEANVVDDTRGKGTFNETRDDDTKGNLRSVDNDSDAEIRERNPEDVFSPADAYDYDAHPADDELREVLQREAGHHG